LGKLASPLKKKTAEQEGSPPFDHPRRNNTHEVYQAQKKNHHRKKSGASTVGENFREAKPQRRFGEKRGDPNDHRRQSSVAKPLKREYQAGNGWNPSLLDWPKRRRPTRKGGEGCGGKKT